MYTYDIPAYRKAFKFTGKYAGDGTVAYWDSDLQESIRVKVFDSIDIEELNQINTIEVNDSVVIGPTVRAYS